MAQGARNFCRDADSDAYFPTRFSPRNNNEQSRSVACLGQKRSTIEPIVESESQSSYNSLWLTCALDEGRSLS